jgi:helix-turn-helix resolvase-like protein
MNHVFAEALAVRDALIGFVPATAQGTGRSHEGRSEGWNQARKGQGRGQVSWPQAELTRRRFTIVRQMLSQDSVGIARIAREIGLSRQTVYRIKNDPAEAEAALAAWGSEGGDRDASPPPWRSGQLRHPRRQWWAGASYPYSRDSEANIA